MLVLAGIGAIAFLAHNAWYQHQQLQAQHERITQLEAKQGPTATPTAK